MSSKAGSLNLIGAGRVGSALGQLWARAGVFEVQDVLTRSRASANAAVHAMGAGRAAEVMDDMRAADVWLLATPDDAIAPVCAGAIGRALTRSQLRCGR